MSSHPSSPPPLVLGLGDPVLDICINVDHDFLRDQGLKPGGCDLIGPEDAAALHEAAIAHAAAANGGGGHAQQQQQQQQEAATQVPGGSAANVLKGLAGLAGGAVRCRLVGVVGADGEGARYASQLRAAGVEPALTVTASGAPTARCLCLITPSGERTMRTCIGAAAELTSADQLAAAWAAAAPPALLHVEGYALHRGEGLLTGAAAAARRSGGLVSLDLASFEVVEACRDTLMRALAAGAVDIVFMNELEAQALVAGDENAREAAAAAAAAGADARAAAVDAAQALVLRYARVCVVSLGARGAVAASADGERGAAPAAQVAVVDTVGAGDLFSAGFLHAYLHGARLDACCAAGCAAGAEAVQARGAALPEPAWVRLRAQVSGIVERSRAVASAPVAFARGGGTHHKAAAAKAAEAANRGSTSPGLARSLARSAAGASSLASSSSLCNIAQHAATAAVATAAGDASGV